MREYRPTEILRSNDGSIDIAFYRARANLARLDAMREALRTGARLLKTFLRAIARRSASWRSPLSRGAPPSLT